MFHNTTYKKHKRLPSKTVQSRLDSTFLNHILFRDEIVKTKKLMDEEGFALKDLAQTARHVKLSKS